MKKVIVKNVFSLLTLALLVALPMGTVSAYEAITGPTEMIYHNDSKAYQGYTLFSPLVAKMTYLIDMQGNVVNEWGLTDDVIGFGNYGYLLENGNLLRAVRPANSLMNAGGGAGGRLEEVNWNGDIVWSFTYDDEKYLQHHDFKRIWNKKLQAYTTIFIAWDIKTGAETTAIGADQEYTDVGVDTIVEVDMNGNIVWKWSFWDHLTQHRDPNAPNYQALYADGSGPRGKLDMDWTPMKGDWQHCNSLDYNEELDQVVINSRVTSEFYVIDHNTTTAEAAGAAGDFLYRFGNPSVYGAGDAIQLGDEGHQQMYGSHDIHWIAPYQWGQGPEQTFGPELPGAGNFLIFDNGCFSPMTKHSEILEINPYVSSADYDSASGELTNVVVENEYVDSPLAGYYDVIQGGPTAESRFNQSKQIAWAYRSPALQNFYSPYISGAQRQPNGNTLICSGAWGHFFEVTPDGEVVWEYTSPIFGVEGANGAGTFASDEYLDGNNNAVFRCYRYSADHPALKGRALTTMGTITNPTEFSGFGFGGGIGGSGGGGGAAGGGAGAGY